MISNEVVPVDSVAIDDSIVNQFYAPVSFDGFSSLVSSYETTKKRIIDVHALVTNEHASGVMHYFFEGNGKDKYGHSASLRHLNSFGEVFQLQGALFQLTADYWDKALRQTDLMEYMPQERRSQWHNILNAWRDPKYVKGENPEQDMPEFTVDNLRATIEGLQSRRAEFLAERVDGIFKGLSRQHVTNVPEGFSKRMIMSGVFNEWGSTSHEREGYIHDLRMVIAKFMGRDDPCRSSTQRLLLTARAASGEWVEADAGAFRVKAFKVGTAHLDVHPEMAYRLNSILAYLHPAAIPESFRKRPKRAPADSFKHRPLFDRPFSNAVGALLAQIEPFKKMVKSKSFRRDYDYIPVRNAVSLPFSCREQSKHLRAEVEAIMQALGGVLTPCTEQPRITYWQFDFDALDLIHETAALGVIPDQRSHQFYPTPEAVARELVDWLDIGLLDTVCEPQAGQGGIADLLPKDRTRCVEISPLHCEILRKKGHQVIEGDFLAWSPGDDFSVIAMNPPYSEGRWQAHLQHAGTLVAQGGRIGAVLPLSARGKAADLLPGFDLEFSQPIDNAFAGTSISVLLLKATKR